MCRVHKLGLAAIKAIPIIPLVYRLTRFHVLEVLSLIYLCFHAMVISPPHANFHLVMTVVGARIKDEYVSSSQLGPYVPLPEITVDQTGFDGSTFRL